MDDESRLALAEQILTTLPMFFERLINRRGPRGGPGGMHLLHALKENPGIIMTALSQQLNMPKSNLSVAVDKLVKAGLVEREFSEHDRRLVSLRLTEKGEEQLELRRRRIYEDAVLGVRRLSDEDVVVLRQHIEGMARILQKYEKSEE